MARKNAALAAFTIVMLAILIGACARGIPAWNNAESADTGPQAVEGGIKFTIQQPKAVKVAIAGDFNDWSTTSDPLFDREKTGQWTLIIPLAPGTYQYKFVIDGEKWIPDPGNQKRVKDGFDGFNSVVDVGPAKAAIKKPE